MGNDARSVFIVLLALAGMGLIWYWASGRAAALVKNLTGAAAVPVASAKVPATNVAGKAAATGSEVYVATPNVTSPPINVENYVKPPNNLPMQYPTTTTQFPGQTPTQVQPLPAALQSTTTPAFLSLFNQPLSSLLNLPQYIAPAQIPLDFGNGMLNSSLWSFGNLFSRRSEPTKTTAPDGSAGKAPAFAIDNAELV